MGRKKIIIDGNNFSSMNGFYDEIENKLTSNLDWEIGRNLDALNDILEGGFGVFKYKEPASIVWKNSEKNKTDLSYQETLKYLKNKLKGCHLSWIDILKNEIKSMEKGKGVILFDRIVDLIRRHKHIELSLD